MNHWKKLVALTACVALFGGCGYVGFVEQANPETGKTETVWSAEAAQKNVEKTSDTLEKVAESTGQSSNPFYLAATAALSLLSGALGVAAKVQNSNKNKLVVALKETTLAAADLIKNDGGDVKKLVDAAKQIQDKTGTRNAVKKTLADTENIAKQ